MSSRFLDLASGRKVRPLIMMTNKRNTHVMRTIKSFIFSMWSWRCLLEVEEGTLTNIGVIKMYHLDLLLQEEKFMDGPNFYTLHSGHVAHRLFPNPGWLQWGHSCKMWGLLWQTTLAQGLSSAWLNVFWNSAAVRVFHPQRLLPSSLLPWHQTHIAVCLSISYLFHFARKLLHI
jgi:hypothetical protein